MSTEIKLPPFVAQSLPFGGYTYEDIVKYARAAVEADREGRVAKSQDELDRLNPYTHAKGSKAVWESGYRAAERNNGIRPAGGEHG